MQEAIVAIPESEVTFKFELRTNLLTVSRVSEICV